MQQPALLILIKNPIAGKTKTRLAQDVGNEMALKMYHILMANTRDQALQVSGVDRYLHYSEWVEGNDEWPADAFTKLVQEGPGLGERMHNAFTRAFARGHDRVVIIGSDCPGVTSDILVEAFAALRENELVVGPALDGGYYLIGMRKPRPELFLNMQWSTSHVLEDTLERATGLSVAQLPALSDVDHLEDWLSYGWKIPDGADEDYN